MAEHSPLPWRLDVYSPRWIATGDVLGQGTIVQTMLGCADKDTAKANAALIVRAVNAYQPLVEALRDVLGEAKCCCDPILHPVIHSSSCTNARLLLAQIDQEGTR